MPHMHGGRLEHLFQTVSFSSAVWLYLIASWDEFVVQKQAQLQTVYPVQYI